MRHRSRTPAIRRAAARIILLLIPALVAAGCRSAQVHLPAEPDRWQAYPGDCAEVLLDFEVVVNQGRIVAKDFAWANSEIEFKVFDPGNASFVIAFYDDNFAKARRKAVRASFDMVNGKRVPMLKSRNLWQLDRVHSFGLGGDQELVNSGYRTLAGAVTTEVDPAGLDDKKVYVVMAEDFKINNWNHIRIRVREGVITVWVNARKGEDIQTDRRLGGTFGFESVTGRLRLADIRLKNLYEGSGSCKEQTENTR